MAKGTHSSFPCPGKYLRPIFGAGTDYTGGRMIDPAADTVKVLDSQTQTLKPTAHNITPGWVDDTRNNQLRDLANWKWNGFDGYFGQWKVNGFNREPAGPPADGDGC